jgi:hypothetical protein
MDIQWPKHEASLHLSHNPHKSNYETVEQYAKWRELDNEDWASEEQKNKAIATNDVWELQWYPNTPIGFNIMLAADLDVLLDAVNKNE